MKNLLCPNRTMARQKGQEVTQTLETRSKRLYRRFKGLHGKVVPPNVKAFTAFLLYCEKKLDTFDPQHVNYVDRGAQLPQGVVVRPRPSASRAKLAPPKKKLVPLQVVEVVHAKKTKPQKNAVK